MNIAQMKTEHYELSIELLELLHSHASRKSLCYEAWKYVRKHHYHVRDKRGEEKARWFRFSKLQSKSKCDRKPASFDRDDRLTDEEGW